MGTAASILPLIAGYLFANYIGKQVKTQEEMAEADPNSKETFQTYEELIKSYGQLPSAFMYCLW